MEQETNLMKFLENKVGHLTGVCFANCNPYFSDLSKKDTTIQLPWPRGFTCEKDIKKFSKLLILETLDMANISNLQSEVHFPLFYSNESLASLFCITNLSYSKLLLL